MEKPLGLAHNMKRKTRKQHQCAGGASKLCKSRTIKKIQQTREGMTPIVAIQSYKVHRKNQLPYHLRLFNAFECPIIPFLPNEPFATKMESWKYTFVKKPTCQASTKLKGFKNCEKPIV